MEWLLYIETDIIIYLCFEKEILYSQKPAIAWITSHNTEELNLDLGLAGTVCKSLSYEHVEHEEALGYELKESTVQWLKYFFPFVFLPQSPT